MAPSSGFNLPLNSAPFSPVLWLQTWTEPSQPWVSQSILPAKAFQDFIIDLLITLSHEVMCAPSVLIFWRTLVLMTWCKFIPGEIQNFLKMQLRPPNHHSITSD